MFKFTVRNCYEKDIYVMDEVDWKTTMSRVGIVASACAAIGANLARNAIVSGNTGTKISGVEKNSTDNRDTDSDHNGINATENNSPIVTTGSGKDSDGKDSDGKDTDGKDTDGKNADNQGTISAPVVIAAAVTGGLIAEELLRSNAGIWEEFSATEDASIFKSKANKVKPRQKYEFKTNNPTNRRVIILDPDDKFWRGSCWNKDHYTFFTYSANFKR